VAHFGQYRHPEVLLRTVTKIHGIIKAVALIIGGGLWAVAGFPHFTEVVAFAGLAVIRVGGIYKWMESQS
jgi:membrane protein implicated in regulation of membrane protease activity